MAIFIREAMISPLIELTPAHFPHIVEGSAVIDFFAPWCPPCMKLLPELRKAAGDMPKMVFGSVDCAAHAKLCQQVVRRVCLYLIKHYGLLLQSVKI